MPDEDRNGSDQRPSPEALLAEVGQEGRGRLKIFLGAAPGVGKTYEMLTSARRRKLDGVDVVVGLVETHGRRETAALLAGLEIVPRRRVPLSRPRARGDGSRPAAASAARSWRWSTSSPTTTRRAAAIPSAGWTSRSCWRPASTSGPPMNVQHVESLNDVVAQITHVRVRETVPDSVLDQAEIELIDLTPDELRERLHEGKVYVPEAAGRALDHYFSHGNLTALRELALRRTAERVDDQMVQYMRAHGLAGPWAARRAAAGLRPWRRGCGRAGPLHQAAGRPAARTLDGDPRPDRRPTGAPARPPTTGSPTRCAWPSGWAARPWSCPASGSPRRSWPGRAPTTSPRSSSAACAARAGATGSAARCRAT